MAVAQPHDGRRQEILEGQVSPNPDPPLQLVADTERKEHDGGDHYRALHGRPRRLVVPRERAHEAFDDDCRKSDPARATHSKILGLDLHVAIVARASGVAKGAQVTSSCVTSTVTTGPWRIATSSDNDAEAKETRP